MPHTSTHDTYRHYELLLGLEPPWEVASVSVDSANLMLSINVAWRAGKPVMCPLCNKPCIVQDHREERSWRHLDTMQFETRIICRVPRSSCPEHGIKTIDTPWANDRSRFTLLFERFAIDVINASKSVTQAMSILKISWEQVWLIKEHAVERGIARRADEPLVHVGIDEKNFGKGHSYVSLLTDVDRGKVLEVVPDRTKEAADGLWRTVSKERRSSIKAVAMDMWDAFMTASKEAVPQAEIVHDKYHVASYLGRAVDEVRRKENRILVQAGNGVLKNTKYLWLANPDRWSADDRRSFRSMRVDELKVGRAWSIKEAFRHFWDYSYNGSAMTFFKNWFFWATHSKIKPIIAVARMLKRHLPGILAYIKHHITNAVTEGLNSKIQILKSNARGFRNFQHYRTAILFHCGKLSLYP